MLNRRGKTALAIVSLLMLANGCQTPVPVAVSCPPTPPIPQAISGYASPRRNLIEDSSQLLLDFRNELLQTLRKASGQPM